MKRILFCFTTVISGCVTNSSNLPENYRCFSYDDCTYLIGSIKATQERRENAVKRGWPIPVHLTPPIYPVKAFSEKVEGYALVEYEVTLNGNPINIRISESFPEGYFEEAAAQSVKYYKYEKDSREYENVKTKVFFNFE